jgi:hypothetical protein
MGFKVKIRVKIKPQENYSLAHEKLMNSFGYIRSLLTRPSKLLNSVDNRGIEVKAAVEENNKFGLFGCKANQCALKRYTTFLKFTFYTCNKLVEIAIIIGEAIITWHQKRYGARI